MLSSRVLLFLLWLLLAFLVTSEHIIINLLGFACKEHPLLKLRKENLLIKIKKDPLLCIIFLNYTKSKQDLLFLGN